MNNPKLFSIIFTFVLIFHSVFISHKFLQKKNEQQTDKRVNEMTVRKVVLQKPIIKPKKKRIKPPRYVPAFSSDPIIEDLMEEELELEEDEDIWIEDYVEITELQPVLSESEIMDIKEKYINQIYILIEKLKFYPKMAKRLNQEGTVEIIFTILQDGSVVDVKLEKTSNFYSIDKAALEAVGKMKKIEPIPTELNKEKWELILPIKFELS